MRAFLELAGPSRVEVRPLRITHEAAGAEELWRGLLGGTARISTVLARQPDDVRARVREAFAARVSPDGGSVTIPAAITLGCATF
jgi:hypothetical protein